MDRRSPVNATTAADAAAEDGDDTSRKKMLQRYGSLSGKLHMIELEKDPAAHGLGIRLSGNEEGSRARMSVYVEGIDPNGPAGLDGRIHVGDELLEINGQILYGRSHQNATTIINNAPSKVKIILIRNKAGQMLKRIRREDEDTVDSKTDAAEGESEGIEHIILPQDHVGLGLCFGEDYSKTGVVVKSLIQHSTASKVSSLILKDPVTVKLSISRSKTLPFSSSQPFPSSLSHHPHLPAVSSEPRRVSQSSSTSLGTEQTSPAECSHWPASSPSTSDPRSCPILPGRETTIEICKESLGLGLSIVGGCDTLLVNNIDLRQATHDEAIAVLRLTTQQVQLRVFRHQEAYREEDLWDIFSLELTPRPEEGLGFTTVGKSDDTGIFVSEIIRGSVAESDGSLLHGDQILSINGEDVRATSQEHAERLLQECTGAVHLEVARFKAGIQYSQRSKSEASDCSKSGCDSSFCHQREKDNKTRSCKAELRKVTIQKGPCDTLGISLAGGVSSPHGNVPLIIASMDTNGLAAKTCKLETGDRILSINDVSTEGMTHDHAEALLKNATGTISLQVAAAFEGCSSQDPSEAHVSSSDPTSSCSQNNFW
ncbi:hypothetical protein CCH79_00012398 [Gambusia affinis]|uniref:PDZ domain-containing protein n=1 Tax=Gambusia affinis TaxID=33528 RepID=A0A315WB49_GAMAF|nr:hypothetical protein CCH79_00012398 [Gambusia affinis]